jgi:lysophospholipase L1-like esterase
MGKLHKSLTVLAVAYSAGVTLVASPLAFQPLRHTYLNELALRWARHSPPKFALLGDSLTDNGSPWGLRLTSSPAGAVAVARGGATSWQIEELLPRALELKPANIVVTAGTNDVASPDYDLEKSVTRITGLVRAAGATGAHVIFTLPPPAADVARSEKTRILGNHVAAALRGSDVSIIDLWPMLSARGVIRQEYTVDGIHFTEGAYKVWATEITKRAR